jgi:hypothetical protein
MIALLENTTDAMILSGEVEGLRLTLQFIKMDYSRGTPWMDFQTRLVDRLLYLDETYPTSTWIILSATTCSRISSSGLICWHRNLSKFASASKVMTF